MGFVNRRLGLNNHDQCGDKYHGNEECVDR